MTPRNHYWRLIQFLLDKELYFVLPNKYRHLVSIAREMSLLRDEIWLLNHFMEQISDEWNTLPVKGRTERYNAYMLLYGVRERAKQKYSELRMKRWTRR